ncbi:MFS transporter [Streptosporangium sp. NPDC023825]|uniref:MFS transporter n=1 Tax=Streptosporangium sp. NPDC023825 TaxID=3154909 RepID=UPI003442F7A9
MISPGPPRRRSPSFLPGGLSQQLGMCVQAGMIAFSVMSLLDIGYGEIGLLQVAALLMPLLLALPLGVLVDRVRRRSVLVVAGLLSAGSLASLAVVSWLGVAGIPHFAAVIAVLAIVWTAGEIARNAYVPSVVGRDRLVPVNAALFCVASIGSLAVPPMLGDHADAVVPAVLAVMAVASAASVPLFRRLDVPEEPPGPRTGWWREATAGVRFTLTQPVLRAMTVYLVGSALLEPLVDELGRRPPRGEDGHENLVAVLSLVIKVAPAAGALVAVLLHRRVGALRLAWLAVAVTQPFVLLLALTGTAGGPLWYLLGEFVPWAGWTATALALLSHRQVITPGRLLGRTGATLILFTGLATIAGTFVQVLILHLIRAIPLLGEAFPTEAGPLAGAPVLVLCVLGALAAAIPLRRVARTAGPAPAVSATPATSPRED